MLAAAGIAVPDWLAEAAENSGGGGNNAAAGGDDDDDDDGWQICNFIIVFVMPIVSVNKLIMKLLLIIHRAAR